MHWDGVQNGALLDDDNVLQVSTSRQALDRLQHKMRNQ